MTIFFARLFSFYLQFWASTNLQLALFFVIHFQLMQEVVPDGEELMPHRNPENIPCAEDHDQADPPELCAQRTPIRKLTRNRGLVMQQDQMVVAETPEEKQPTSKRRRLFRDQQS
jgi:hypothetical protein